MNNILTETQTVNILKTFFEKRKYVHDCRTGYHHGCDIDARKGNDQILIEVKGAKANKWEIDALSKVFSKQQIKNHLAVALLKAINMQRENNGANIRIAIKRFISIKLNSPNVFS